ncbi:MAG: lysylphosphatidylglycerol synthase transmembrane domain-containing protein [Candidatus Odinarchaeota archaeon]
MTLKPENGTEPVVASEVWKLRLDLRGTAVMVFLFLVLIIYILFLGLEQIWYAITAMNLLVLTLAIVVYYSTLLVRAIRWRVFLLSIEKENPPPTLVDLFTLIVFSFAINNLFPVRMGELYRPYELSREKDYHFLSAAATILLERTMDVIVMGGLVVGVLILQGTTSMIGTSEIIQNLAFSAAIIGGFILFLFLLQNEKATEFLLRVINAFVGILQKKIIANEEATAREIVAQVSLMVKDRKNLVFGFLTGVLIWLLEGGTFWLVVVAANVNISPLVALALLLLAGLIGNSIFSAAGLGQLPFMIAFMVILGLSDITATSVSVTYLVVVFWLIIPVGIILHNVIGKGNSNKLK